MERYNRVYRDPASPLTPLTPLSTEAFTFEDVTPTGGVGRKGSAKYGLFGTSKENNLTVPNSRPALSGLKRLSESTLPRRFSQKFMRTRSVFSPTSQSTFINGETKLMGESGDSKLLRTRREDRPKPDIRLQQQTRLKQEESKLKSARTKIKVEDSRSPTPSIHHPRYKPCSPVEHPTLSPRVKSLLDRTGNAHLTELFTRQEIDIEVLIQMTLEDLAALGVRGAREIRLAMNIIQLAKQFF
uniref:CG5272 protein n=1 Tax=Drosophila simulans TaxID=7240 RepID=A0AP28_DROSI|nr:CG5272 [Drosophila simulans]